MEVSGVDDINSSRNNPEESRTEVSTTDKQFIPTEQQYSSIPFVATEEHTSSTTASEEPSENCMEVTNETVPIEAASSAASPSSYLQQEPLDQDMSISSDASITDPMNDTSRISSSSIVRIYDRRINLNDFPTDASLYSLLRAWIQDDPYRSNHIKNHHAVLVEIEEYERMEQQHRVMNQQQQSTDEYNMQTLLSKVATTGSMTTKESKTNESVEFNNTAGTLIDSSKDSIDVVGVITNNTKSNNNDDDDDSYINQLKLEMIQRGKKCKQRINFKERDKIVIENLRQRGIQII
jgi:hypothetical protein